MTPKHVIQNYAQAFSFRVNTSSGNNGLSLQESASQKELEEKLQSLKVDKMQLLCKETGVKHLGRKSELIERLLNN